MSERQTLIGQIGADHAAAADAKISALYGDAWHPTALVNGVFSTLALLVATFVLALPAFGSPERTLPTWVRSVSWAGVGLGALGILLFVLMYFDLLLAIPKAAGQPSASRHCLRPARPASGPPGPGLRPPAPADAACDRCAGTPWDANLGSHRTRCPRNATREHEMFEYEIATPPATPTSSARRPSTAWPGRRGRRTAPPRGARNPKGR